MRILKRVIVSPAVYPRFLEIAELARGLSAIAELLVSLLRRSRITVKIAFRSNPMSQVPVLLEPFY